MAPILRFGALAAFALFAYGCGGSGGGSSGQVNARSVTVTCTPDFIEKLGTSQCVAVIDGSPAAVGSIEWSVSAGTIDADGRFIAPENAGNVTITARDVQTSDSGSLTVVVSGARALADRPDEGEQWQVHVLYVVPGDGEDRTLDTNGTIALSVESWNAWLEAQTGGSRLHLDRSGGALDVSFVRLSRDNDDMNDFGPQMRDQIEGELVARGFDDPNKVYLAYYDGGDAMTGACGGSAYPPVRPGVLAVMYLEAIPAVGNPCRENAFAESVDSPGYMELAALREVLHVVGMVPECAPNQVQVGHVADSPNDLLYAGDQAWNPTTLDVNRNDYYAAGINDCIDLADSAFLEPRSTPFELPPGWPYGSLTALECAQEGALESTDGDPTSIQFVNSTPQGAIVYRLNEVGIRELVRELGPWEGFVHATQTTNYFVMTTDTNECLGIYTGTTTLGRAIARPL